MNGGSICFCTLAIHAPYRRRARLLCADLAPAPIFILTDEPADFSDLPVRALHHRPTGPMAIDYVQRFEPTGVEWGAAAYHDKRFALEAALQDFDSAIFLDADTRAAALPFLGALPAGLAVTRFVDNNIATHLTQFGAWRFSAFEDLARSMFGDSNALQAARWCQETPLAVTKDGNEDTFFSAWEHGANFLQAREIYSGEGGVIGLAALQAGWRVDYDALAPLVQHLHHESGGPKAS